MEMLDIEVYKGADNVLPFLIDGDNQNFSEGEFRAAIKRRPDQPALAWFDCVYDNERGITICAMDAEETKKITFLRPERLKEEFCYDLLFYFCGAVRLICFGKAIVYAGVTYGEQR